MYGGPVKAKTPAKVQPAERPKQAVLLAPNAAAAEALNKPIQPAPKPSRVMVRSCQHLLCDGSSRVMS